LKQPKGVSEAGAQTLFEMQKEDNSPTWSDDEVKSLCGCLAKAINDNCLLLNGKDKQIQANDCIT
jgi:hypothetical protein